MDKNYQDLFFSEAEEYVREINKALVSLEKDREDKDAINLIFRHVHTLKGMAATIGYGELAKFAHRLEDIFDIIRSGQKILSSDDLDIIFGSIDVLTIFLNDLKENRPISVDVPGQLNRLDTLVSQKQKSDKKDQLTTLLGAQRKQGKNIYIINVTLIDDCPMKGVRAFLIAQILLNMGDILAISPPMDALKNEDFSGIFECILASSLEQTVIYDELNKISEISKVTVSKKPTVLPTFKSKIQGIRISTDKLERVMNLIGELVIVKNRLSQTVRNKDFVNLDDSTYLVEQLVSLLQDEILKMRLLPISYITDNFHRFVRDTAKALGKDITLEIIGSEIELDRVILDELGDLLTHLLKNAIDHGIESSEERIHYGKNPQGNILVKIFRAKGYITILIQDDGRGIDNDLIIKKALDMNLISEQEAEHYEPSRIMDILTIPGFSSKEDVTDLSGRGVGLDVVKNRLDSLGGSLELTSEKGKGSLFTMTLPLSLAIIKAMLVACGSETYAIPLMSVRETIKIKKKDIKSVGNSNVIVIRNEVIPFLELDNILELKRSSLKDSEDILTVIIERGNKSLGFAVDTITGEQDIVVKPLGSFFRGIKTKGITGATVLGNGRVALILDMVNIAK